MEKQKAQKLCVQKFLPKYKHTKFAQKLSVQYSTNNSVQKNQVQRTLKMVHKILVHKTFKIKHWCNLKEILKSKTNNRGHSEIDIKQWISLKNYVEKET
jgi:hypothetical protein